MNQVRGERYAVRGMTRRTFVETIAGAGLAAVLPRVPLTAHRARIEKIGLQLYTVRKAMQADVEGTLARVAATGYKEVEFAGYFGKTPTEIRALLDRFGLSSPAVHVGSLAADAWRASLEAATTIGHRYVVVPWIPAEQRGTLDGWKRVAENFNRVAAEARAAGLQLAYHNHDFEFAPVEGRIPYDVLLESTDPHLVQLEIDLYWMTKGGQDPLTYFQRWPGRIPLVHVKDSAGPPDNKMVDVGAGTIDWKRIFARRDQAGIRHFFVEHDQPADLFASIKASYDYLSKLEF
ncbi:MAG TPA: sugar phosphate isomerase/epimerase [Gemmatimonadales bacterium]|nr:sugar phosphate isomerase/epimerase [Gemmatimonadales bacterium]